MSSHYVRRVRSDGRVGWTGPIRSAAQATREAAAWNTAEFADGGRWNAEVVASTPDVRAQIRAWEKAKETTR